MKRFNQILLLLSISCATLAQSPFEGYPSNGFYRVQNYRTGRYAYVLDNTGSLDYATMDAEMGAIELHRDTARLHYDPASVMFIRQIHHGIFRHPEELVWNIIELSFVRDLSHRRLV